MDLGRGARVRDREGDVAPALTRLRKAAEARRRAGDVYVAAILEARAAGATVTEIADAAGITHQGVSKMLRTRAP